MSILVVNCFHWIGFHLVNECLEQGIEITGMDELETEKKENLSMFVGRNDLFSWEKEIQADQYETIIIIDQNGHDLSYSTNQIINVNYEEKQVNNKSTTEINLPILYGEWMPMNEEALFYQGREIRFNSEEFAKDAIYVKDFIKAFLQWLDGSILPPTIEVLSKENKRVEDLKLENHMYIRDNVPKEQKIKNVIGHYRRYNDFY